MIQKSANLKVMREIFGKRRRQFSIWLMFVCHFTFVMNMCMMQIQRGKLRLHFSRDEDQMLRELVNTYGTDNWELIASHMPQRNIRQCRERWSNFINDQVSHEKWSMEEDALLLEKYKQFGPKWKYLETFFVGRKNYAIRNRFHSLAHKMELLGRKGRAKASPPASGFPSPVPAVSIYVVPMVTEIEPEPLVQETCASQENDLCDFEDYELDFGFGDQMAFDESDVFGNFFA